MHETAISEDVRDLEGECFPESKSQGVKGGVECPALQSGEVVDDALDFL